MNKIRAAVVGAGIYGKHHMNAYRHNPDTVLVAICDTDTERCDDLAMAYGIQGYTRLDRLLQQEAIDIVSVATPDPYHTESILTALRHGQHVLAEKPLATSVRECELIVEMAQQRDLLVGVDFHKRWDPAVMRIKAELENPETGCILRGHISMDDVITVPTQWLNWAGASSPVWFLGSHCFDWCATLRAGGGIGVRRRTEAADGRMRPRHLRQRAEPADNGRRQFVGWKTHGCCRRAFRRTTTGASTFSARQPISAVLPNIAGWKSPRRP